MVRIDEKQEAIAFIRMTVDNAQEALRAKDLDLEPELDDLECQKLQVISNDGSEMAENTWKFGSPEGKKITSRALEANLAPLNRDYHSFDQRLRVFITNNLPEDLLTYEDVIYVRLLCFNLNSSN